MFRIIRVFSLTVLLLLAVMSAATAADATPPDGEAALPAGKGDKKPPPSEPKPPKDIPNSTDQASKLEDVAENQVANDAAFVKYDWKVEELAGEKTEPFFRPSPSGDGTTAQQDQATESFFDVTYQLGEISTSRRILCGEGRPCTPRILRAIQDRANGGLSSEECPVDETGCPDGYHWVVVEVCDVDEEGNESGCELIYDCVEDQPSSSVVPIGSFAGIATSPLGVMEEASAPKQSEAFKGLGGTPLGSKNT